MPCLRRVSQLAYGSGDGEEDSETLMSFALDSAAPGDDDDDWVATHTSRGAPLSPYLRPLATPTNHSSVTDPSAPTKIPTIGDIPDLDASVGSLETGLAGTRLDGSGSAAGGGLEEMPDMDDIPDMDDDDAEGGGLVEEEDDAALKPVTPAKGA